MRQVCVSLRWCRQAGRSPWWVGIHPAAVKRWRFNLQERRNNRDRSCSGVLDGNVSWSWYTSLQSSCQRYCHAVFLHCKMCLLKLLRCKRSGWGGCTILLLLSLSSQHLGGEIPFDIFLTSWSLKLCWQRASHWPPWWGSQTSVRRCSASHHPSCLGDTKKASL